MSELHLIRSKTVCEMPSCYEEKTEVLVFGDVAGYQALQEALRAAMSTGQITRPSSLGIDRNSMRVCILPASATARRHPQLKLIERIVFVERSPEMELVIYGNAAGYSWLIDAIEQAATTYLGDPSEHIHLDDFNDPRMVRRSVAMNIRGALRSWSRDELEHYAALVFDRQPTYLPSNIGHLTRATCPYEYPVPGTNPYILR